MRRWVAVLAVMVGMSAAAWAVEKPFDTASDPAKDLRAAENKAEAEHKRILLDVGGDMWPWSRVLESTLSSDPEIHELLEKSFVVVRVSVTQQNPNFEFRASYPRSRNGFPVLYVLSSAGTLLTMNEMGRLEKTHKPEDGYDKQALKEFLRQYATK